MPDLRLPYRYGLFWLAAIGGTIILAAVGVSTAWLIVASIVVLVLVNLGKDSRGTNNAIFLIVTYFLGVFPFRYLVGSGLLDSTSLYSTVFYAVTILVLGVELLRMKSFPRNPLFAPASVLLAIMGIAFLVSPEPFANVRRVIFNVSINYIILMIAMLAAARADAQAFLGVLLRTFLVCGLFDVAYGVYQFIGGTPEFELNAFVDLGMGTTFIFSADFIKIIGVNGSAYGLFYNLCFYLLAFIMIPPSHLKVRAVVPGLIVVGSLVLLSSLSERTALIMTAIMVIMIAAIRYSGFSVRKLVVSGVAGLAIVVVLYVALVPLFKSFEQEEGFKYERMAELADPSEATNMLWRYTKWEEGLQLLPSSLLLGDGLRGEYGFHMEYLNVIISFGIAGFLAWSLLLGRALRILWHSAGREGLAEGDRRLALVLVAFFFAMLAAAIPNNPFIYTSGLVFLPLAAAYGELWVRRSQITPAANGHDGTVL